MKKFKFISSIVVTVIVLAVICLGIVVAVSPQYGITNSVTFNPTDNLSFSVVCEATWAIESESGGKDTSITISIDEDGNITPTNRWDAPDINFNKVLPNTNEVMMSFKFTNTSGTLESPVLDNILVVSFEGIESDSKNTMFVEDPRFVAEVQTIRTVDGEEVASARKVVSGDEANGADALFEVPSGETVTLNIYYVLERENANIDIDQNIKINIGLKENVI